GASRSVISSRNGGSSARSMETSSAANSTPTACSCAGKRISERARGSQPLFLCLGMLPHQGFLDVLSNLLSIQGGPEILNPSLAEVDPNEIVAVFPKGPYREPLLLHLKAMGHLPVEFGYEALVRSRWPAEELDDFMIRHAAAKALKVLGG